MYVHRGLGPIIACSNDDPMLTLTYTAARSFLNLDFSIRKVKTVDFTETIVACDLKARRSRQLTELMKVCDY